jgi:REP element-mobilizing transposase RayT
MTAPRQVLPGTTYLVTRRCLERQFFLRPSRVTNQVFLYSLALAVRSSGVLVHALCVMSNHYHLLVTDPNAQLPAFLQQLDSLVGRAINASLGRTDHFWESDSYSAVALLSPMDVVEKAAYTLANPVAAGLVRSPWQWPGLWSAPEGIGGDALVVARPGHFFDPKGYLPKSLELSFHTPPGFVSSADFRDQLQATLERKVSEAIERRGLKFLGRRRVLRQLPTAKPRHGEQQRELNPRVAGRDRWKRIEALGRLVEFLRSYRAARLARQSGDLSAIFPAGTYLLRVQHNVPCEAFG